MKLGGRISHIALAPGNNLSCPCGQPASRFMLCPNCKHIVATCGGHKTTIQQETDNHCLGKK